MNAREEDVPWFPDLVAALAALLAALPSSAQDYPSRPVRIVVPYGTGVAPDVIARIARWGEVVRKSGVKLQD